MMNKVNIEQLIKLSGKYDLTIFSSESIDRVEKSIFEKDNKYFLKCIKRNKEIHVKPEEVVRQLMLDKLINEYDYPVDLLEVEYTVNFGREKKFADIVILNKEDKTSVYCVLEIKKHKAKDGKDQLKSYTNATGAPLAVWTNGIEIDYYERLDPNYFEPLSDIPKYNETIDDIKQEIFTYLDLMLKDRLVNERKSLKDLILELEDEVLANAGVDIFEEVFKLIFTKLYDEMESRYDRDSIEMQLKLLRKQHKGKNDKELLQFVDSDDFRKLEFRSRGDAYHTKEVINKLFEKSKRKWPGIFDDGEPLRITDENHLQICVGFLQNVKLFNSNLQVIDEAFEYLVNKSAKGAKGQYFTPRNVIDMAVYMMNPQKDEFMIDTAAGSCGFTVHTLANVWHKLDHNGENKFKADFRNINVVGEKKNYVEKVFGIDFDEKSVRVAKTLNMIAGDGKTNVLHLNSLDFTRWNEKIKDREWMRKYGEGYYRLLDLAVNRDEPKAFNFDIVLANPPFAGDIKDNRLLSQYEISYKENGKKVSKLSRDILFIERNLNMLKPGGRMAIVLPQGRFNNTSDERVRQYIMEHARLLAVVGLDVNTFKPHAGVKTSIMFIQKWNDDPSKGPLNPKLDDYEIFMAVSEKSGKDNSGQEVYKTDENGNRLLDEHGHLILDHDLEDIAKEFEKWAKEQGLSFWK